MEPIIAAEHLGKTYRSGKLEVQALRDVTFSVDPGEFVGLPFPGRAVQSHSPDRPFPPWDSALYDLNSWTRPSACTSDCWIALR